MCASNRIVAGSTCTDANAATSIVHSRSTLALTVTLVLVLALTLALDHNLGCICMVWIGRAQCCCCVAGGFNVTVAVVSCRGGTARNSVMTNSEQ